MICPCMDCADRHEACHDSCDGYKAWKAEDAATKAWLREQVPTVPESALQDHYKRLRRGKTKKWNVKTKHGGEGRW